MSINSLTSILPFVDLTSLKEDDTEHAMDVLCQRVEAVAGNIAALCVYPKFISYLKNWRLNSPYSHIKLATVANFPSGDASLAQGLAEIADSLAQGADEIDWVFPYRIFLQGDWATARARVAAVRAAAGTATLKVILETGLYPDQANLRAAAEMAVEEGVDFVKTSTGKVEKGADPAAVAVLLDVIAASGGQVGIKISGGVRTLTLAQTYLAQVAARMGEEWLTSAHVRIGASGLV